MPGAMSDLGLVTERRAGAAAVSLKNEEKSEGACPYLRPCSWKEQRADFLILLVGNRPAGGVQPGGNLIQSSKQAYLTNPSVQCLLMSSL